MSKYGFPSLLIKRIFPWFAVLVVSVVLIIAEINGEISSPAKTDISTDEGTGESSDRKSTVDHVLAVAVGVVAGITSAMSLSKSYVELKAWKNKGSCFFVKSVGIDHELIPEIARDLLVNGKVKYAIIQCAEPNGKSYILPINVSNRSSESNTVKLLDVDLVCGFSGANGINEIDFESVEVKVQNASGSYNMKPKLLKANASIMRHLSPGDEIELAMKLLVDKALLVDKENCYAEIVLATKIKDENKQVRLDFAQVMVLFKYDSEQDNYKASLMS